MSQCIIFSSIISTRHQHKRQKHEHTHTQMQEAAAHADHHQPALGTQRVVYLLLLLFVVGSTVSVPYTVARGGEDAVLAPEARRTIFTLIVCVRFAIGSWRDPIPASGSNSRPRQTPETKDGIGNKSSLHLQQHEGMEGGSPRAG